ncbi:MAG TPA: hypothetical protein VHE99_08545 [Gammaproteobacteria bacterium]|nr:hypothetical protein [Gammaproteobacteria bacterium]
MIDKVHMEQILSQHYAEAIKKAPKPDNMSQTQYYNYLAIQLLEEGGNDCPTQEAIDYIENCLKRYARKMQDKFL